MAVTLLFQEVEHNRPSVNPFYYLEKTFYFLVPLYNVTVVVYIALV